MGRPLENNDTAQGRTNQARQFAMHECLGRGGFGEVYRATMVSPGGLQTEVAIKVLRLDVDPNSDAVSRLRDEGKLLAALRHPSILRAHDLALLDGRVALVTEFVDGADLHHCTSGDDRLTPRAAIEVIDAVAEALHAAWSGSLDGREPLRLVHRDIKPSNIRLGSHGEVKLLDFGIARSDEVDREARTGTGSTVGSLAYMAPERFTRSSPGPEADVYALGCTLYEALVGTRLHDDPVPVEMFRLAATPDAHARHVAEALELLPEGAKGARALLLAMLQHDKARRPTAGQVAAQCDALAEETPGLSLKRWARAREWNRDHGMQGTFDGRTITEGSLTDSSRATSSGSVPIKEDTASDTFNFNQGFQSELVVLDPQNTSTMVPLVAPEPVTARLVVPPERAPRWVWGLVVVLAVFGLGVLLVWSMNGVSGSVYSLSFEADGNGVEVKSPVGSFAAGEAARSKATSEPTPEPTPVPVVPVVPVVGPAQADVPDPAPSPVPAPAPDPVPVAAPEPAPVPVATPEPAPAPVADPVPVAAPAPTAVPAPPTLCTVQRTGSKTAAAMKVSLQGAGGTFPLPVGRSEIPEGRYEIVIDGVVTPKQIDVRPGVPNYIECVGTTASCSTQR